MCEWRRCSESSSILFFLTALKEYLLAEDENTWAGKMGVQPANFQLYFLVAAIVSIGAYQLVRKRPKPRAQRQRDEEELCERVRASFRSIFTQFQAQHDAAEEAHETEPDVSEHPKESSQSTSDAKRSGDKKRCRVCLKRGCTKCWGRGGLSTDRRPKLSDEVVKEWRCPSCHTSNGASFRECRKCHLPTSLQTSEEPCVAEVLSRHDSSSSNLQRINSTAQLNNQVHPTGLPV